MERDPVVFCPHVFHLLLCVRVCLWKIFSLRISLIREGKECTKGNSPKKHNSNRLAIELSCLCAQSLQSSLTLQTTMAYRPPSCSVLGILQARTLEWMSQASVQFSLSVVSDFLRPHEAQHTRPRCPSPSPRVHSDSCPSSPRCHPAISSSVVPFSSCPQCLPASESFPVSHLFS